MSITAKELAAKCGVSRGTVDRALKGRGGINAETREKVLKAAEKYDYRPNLLGQALSAGRTMTIGMVLFDFSHSFFAELYSSFEKEASNFNYVLFPMLSYHDPEREIECIRHLRDRNVDGIILLPVNRGKNFESFLHKQKAPTICIGNRLSSKFPFSGLDDRQAAFDAVNHLNEKGHQHIFYYCPPIRHKEKVNLYAQEQRLAGFKAGIKASGAKGKSFIDKEELLSSLSKVSDKKNAVLCSSDDQALRLQIIFRDTYKQFYTDTEIMGFDGLDTLQYANPSISSVSFSREIWANKAFSQIYDRIEGKDVKDYIIGHHII